MKVYYKTFYPSINLIAVNNKRINLTDLDKKDEILSGEKFKGLLQIN